MSAPDWFHAWLFAMAVLVVLSVLIWVTTKALKRVWPAIWEMIALETPPHRPVQAIPCPLCGHETEQYPDLTSCPQCGHVTPRPFRCR